MQQKNPWNATKEFLAIHTVQKMLKMSLEPQPATLTTSTTNEETKPYLESQPLASSPHLPGLTYTLLLASGGK